MGKSGNENRKRKIKTSRSYQALSIAQAKLSMRSGAIS
jgi:hypothetical protein